MRTVQACLLVALALIAPVVAEGGKETAVSPSASSAAILTPGGIPITKEPITVQTLYPRIPVHGDFEKMWFFKELANRTNITIKVQPVEEIGWQEKKNLAFASGDLPDVFLAGIGTLDENTFGPQGLLINIAGLIETHAPLAKEILEKHPDAKKSISHPNGAIYAMPAFNDAKREQVLLRPYINKVWLQNVGLGMPANLDELYAVLKAFKEKDPNRNGQADEIPMSGLFGGGINIVVLSALGHVDARHDVRDKRYAYVPIQNAYREYLAYMNKLYRDGLLDPDYFSQKAEQLLAKEAQMRLGLYTGGGTTGNIKDDKWSEYTNIGPLTSGSNSTKMWRKAPDYYRNWGSLAVTSRAKYPEAMIRLLDYFYTLEGGLMVRCGPELGKHDGPGGWEFVTVDGVKTFKVSYPGYNSFWNFRAQHTPLNVPYYDDNRIHTYLIYNDYKQRWISQSILNSGLIEVARIPYPEVGFTPEEQQKLATYVDLDSYASQMEAKFMRGDTPLTEWDSYVATLKKMGVDEMARLRQAAYDRWDRR